MVHHVLMVIDSLAMGGAEKVVVTLSNSMVELGHTVDIIIIDANQEIEPSPKIGLHTLGFEKGAFAYPRYRRQLYAMIGSIASQYGSGFDGIFVHLQKATRLMRDYRHQKVFFCVHSIISQSSMKDRKSLRLLAKRQRLRKIYDGLDIITVSDGIKEDLIETVGVSVKSIRTIHNPVDIEGILRVSKATLPHMPVGEYIIHVGRLVESKRHDRLIEAYARSGVKAKLVIVGSGEMQASIEAQIIKLGLQSSVLLYGFTENPYPLIANAKLLVLSSDYEGFGNVLVEALCLDVPVVSTDCPSGPREILTGALRTQLVDVEDVDLLAEKIRQTLEEPKTLYYPSFARKFDVKQVLGQYLALL